MKISYKSLLISGTFFSAMLAPLSAQAVQIQIDNNGMTIVGLGVASDGGAFFNVPEYPADDPAKGCVYGLYYVNLDTPGGRSIYATLLLAQATGRKLRRFDWNRVDGSSGNTCHISLVILKD